jgi:hypothetical protein
MHYYYYYVYTYTHDTDTGSEQKKNCWLNTPVLRTNYEIVEIGEIVLVIFTSAGRPVSVTFIQVQSSFGRY